MKIAKLTYILLFLAIILIYYHSVPNSDPPRGREFGTSSEGYVSSEVLTPLPRGGQHFDTRRYAYSNKEGFQVEGFQVERFSLFSSILNFMFITFVIIMFIIMIGYVMEFLGKLAVANELKKRYGT